MLSVSCVYYKIIIPLNLHLPYINFNDINNMITNNTIITTIIITTGIKLGGR